MKKELAALKKRLQEGTWNYFALCSTDGATLVPCSTGKREPARKLADLDHIFEVIEDYPEESLVIEAYLNKAKGSRPKTFAVPNANPKTLDSPPVLSQAHSADIQNAERLGSLETENSFLKAKIADLEKELADYQSLADEEELNEDEENFEEEPKQTWVDYVAPAIPGLLDKASALLDVYINKKLIGQNGNFENIQQIPNTIQEQAPPVLEIDYEKLADMVAKKLEQTGNY